MTHNTAQPIPNTAPYCGDCGKDADNLTPYDEPGHYTVKLCDGCLRQRESEAAARSMPDTEGEWRISTYDESVILATSDARVVARCGSTAIAAQIVADHNSRALLVEALEILRSTLTPVLRDHAVRGNVDRTEGYVLVAVNQIDAALKAAGVEE